MSSGREGCEQECVSVYNPHLGSYTYNVEEDIGFPTFIKRFALIIIVVMVGAIFTYLMSQCFCAGKGLGRYFGIGASKEME